MKLSGLNPVLNLVLFLNICFLAASGLLMEFRLGHGPFRNAVWGMDRHEWAELHSIGSYLLITVILLHLVIHWKWLINVACKKRYWKLCGGMVSGIGLMILIIMGPVTDGDRRTDGHELSLRDARIEESHSYDGLREKGGHNRGRRLRHQR